MPPKTYSHPKVTIIGTGLVGMSYAYALTIKGLVREIGLINRSAARAEGEAMDLSHGLPFVKPMDIQEILYKLQDAYRRKTLKSTRDV